MSCYPQNWVIYTTINPHCFIYLTLCRYLVLPQKLKFHWFLIRRLTAGAWSRQLTRVSNVSPIFGSNTWPCRDTKTDRFFFSSQTKTLRQDVRRTKTHKSYLTDRGLVCGSEDWRCHTLTSSISGGWLGSTRHPHVKVQLYHICENVTYTNIYGGDEGGSSTCMKFTPRGYSFHSFKTSFSVQFPVSCIFVYCYFTLIICNLNEKAYMLK